MASATLRSRPKTTQRAQAPLQLRHAQGVVFQDRKRFRVLIAGRRFGKSFLAIVELTRGSTERPGVYFYIAPTYRMAKEIAWAQLKELMPAAWIRKKNESDLAVELVNGSRIELKGSETLTHCAGARCVA